MEDADNILNSLQVKYLITVDMEATLYIGIKLDWDYVNRTGTLSIPNYVLKPLHIFQHIQMDGKEYSPHICALIQYRQKIQYVDPLDAAEYLSYKEPTPFNKFMELYYIMPLLLTTLFSQPLVAFT